MIPEEQDSWFDEEAGPLVRPFAMTQGRTRPTTVELDMITLVSALRPIGDASGLGVEHEEVLQLCQRPVSVAEVAACLDVPLVVAKVLVGDLVERGDVIVRPPVQDMANPDTDLLQAVLNGIRRL